MTKETKLVTGLYVFFAAAAAFALLFSTSCSDDVNIAQGQEEPRQEEGQGPGASSDEPSEGSGEPGACEEPEERCSAVVRDCFLYFVCPEGVGKVRLKGCLGRDKERD